MAVCAKNVAVPENHDGVTVTAYLEKSQDGTSGWTQTGAAQIVESGPVAFHVSLAAGENHCFFRIRVAVR